MNYFKTIQAEEVEELFQQKARLDPKSVGSEPIVRAVKKGLRTSEIQGLHGHPVGLRASPALFEALVELIVVRETSCFRNRASFTFLRRWVAQDWPQIQSINRLLGVLSMPRSIGEEPYSIAISLLEKGLILGKFHTLMTKN